MEHRMHSAMTKKEYRQIKRFFNRMNSFSMGVGCLSQSERTTYDRILKKYYEYRKAGGILT